MNVFLRLLLATMLALSVTLSAALAAVPNYQGLWYAAPAESEAGWGINFAHQGDVIFATWFTYDANGKAWWLTMTAQKTAEGVYGGDLYRTTGAPFSAFVPPATVTRVGTGTLTFASTSAGTFAYTVNGITQTKAIVTQVFDAVPTCVWGAEADLAKATNFQDLWYAAPAESESGWGVNLTQQGSTIFATWFTYDASGNPLWLSATAPQTTSNTFTGTLYLTSGPAFSAVPFDPTKVKLAPVGTATFTFADGNKGTFSYNVDLGDGVNKANQSKPITRQVFRAPGTVCAPPGGGGTTAEGIWKGTTDQGQPLHIVILDDGTFYIVFSDNATQLEAGVLHGSGSSANGKFTSTNVAQYPLWPSAQPFIGGAKSISGTYIPRTSLQLTIGSSSVSASYDATYDQPVTFASLAGSYLGVLGHITEQANASANMDSSGYLTVSGVQCDYVVTASPRGTVNVSNIAVTNSRGRCYEGPGILVYDVASGKLFALAAFYNGLLGFPDLWYAIVTRR